MLDSVIDCSDTNCPHIDPDKCPRAHAEQNTLGTNFFNDLFADGVEDPPPAESVNPRLPHYVETQPPIPFVSPRLSHLTVYCCSYCLIPMSLSTGAWSNNDQLYCSSCYYQLYLLPQYYFSVTTFPYIPAMASPDYFQTQIPPCTIESHHTHSIPIEKIIFTEILTVIRRNIKQQHFNLSNETVIFLNVLETARVIGEKHDSVTENDICSLISDTCVPKLAKCCPESMYIINTTRNFVPFVFQSSSPVEIRQIFTKFQANFLRTDMTIPGL